MVMRATGQKAIKRDDGTKLYIDTEKTSVSEALVDSQSGEATNGLANNYDHFLFNPNFVKECNGEKAQVEDFLEEDMLLTWYLENTKLEKMI